MTVHESHVMLDGSEHEAGDCPPECTLSASLAKLVDDLKAGRLVLRRVEE